jgi:hypothetical protein
MAGSLGLGPGDSGLGGLTLRQLLWMAEGMGRERWAHTSLICALIANANRDPRKGRPFKPSDFDPYANPRNQDRRLRTVADKQSLAMLRQALEAGKATQHGR